MLQCAHLSNINADPMLTGTLKHAFDFSTKRKLFIGCAAQCDVQIFGIGVQERHAAITRDEKEFYVEPMPGARVMRNGRAYEEKFQLRNFDRLVFGASLFYLFVDPARFDDGEPSSMAERVNSFTIERVQQEIAEKAGIISDKPNGERNAEEIACINELIDLLPSIEEANQMSILMDRKVKYEAIILNPIVIGELNAKPRVRKDLKKIFFLNIFFKFIYSLSFFSRWLL